MIGLGPYIGFGIGGKASIENESTTVESDIVFKNVVVTGDPLLKAYFKTYDAGGNILAGYELANGIFCQLNAQFGVVKINPEDQRISNDRSAVRNIGFGISIGYRF